MVDAEPDLGDILDIVSFLGCDGGWIMVATMVGMMVGTLVVETLHATSLQSPRFPRSPHFSRIDFSHSKSIPNERGLTLQQIYPILHFCMVLNFIQKHIGQNTYARQLHFPVDDVPKIRFAIMGADGNEICTRPTIIPIWVSFR